MADNTKNIFQKIIAGEIPAEKIDETDDYIVINDINPQAPTHVLIIPKSGIPSVSESCDSDCEILGKLLLAAKHFANEHNLCHGFRLVINDGVQAGQTVPHLHVHLLAGRPMGWPPC